MVLTISPRSIATQNAWKIKKAGLCSWSNAMKIGWKIARSFEGIDQPGITCPFNGRFAYVHAGARIEKKMIPGGFPDMRPKPTPIRIQVFAIIDLISEDIVAFIDHRDNVKMIFREQMYTKKALFDRIHVIRKFEEHMANLPLEISGGNQIRIISI